jgi:hypothetical protein
MQLSPTENTSLFSSIHSDSEISQCNSISTIPKPVRVTNFQNYVKSGLRSGKFKWQHQVDVRLDQSKVQLIKCQKLSGTY